MLMGEAVLPARTVSSPSAAPVRPRVHDKGGNVQGGGPRHLAPQGRQGLLVEAPVGRRHVDEIAVVGEDGPDRGPLPKFPIGPDLGLRKGLGPPLVVVFREDLDRIAAGLLPSQQRRRQAPRDRHVRPQARPTPGQRGAWTLLYGSHTIRPRSRWAFRVRSSWFMVEDLRV